MSIRQKLVGGFAGIALLVAIVGYVGFKGSQNIFHKLDIIATETAPELVVLGKIGINIHHMHSEALSFVLLNDEREREEELREFNKTSENLKKAVKELEALEQQEAAEEEEEEEWEESSLEILKEKIGGYYNNCLKIMEARTAGKSNREILAIKERLETAEEELGKIFNDRIESEIRELSRRDESATRTALRTMKLISILTIVSVLFALGLGHGIAASIIKPILKLKHATLEIGKGELATRIEVKTKDEVGELVDSFNKMAMDLSVSKQKLIQSGRLAGIGQLAAGVAHEINNPMQFVGGNLEILKKYQDNLFRIFTEMDRTLNAEANNQVAMIKEKEQFEVIKKNIPELMSDTLDGIRRIKAIIASLRDFAHPVGEEISRVNLNQEIEKAVTLVWNEIKYHNEIKKNLGEIPEISCNRGQIGQVFVNLLINASHATEEVEGKKGIITIRTYQRNSDVYVEFTDNGKGIDEEHMSRIFDPFFTTKEAGKGTGLGLSIVYSVIKNHNWTMEIKSEFHEGTAFIIKIPLERI